MPNGMLIPMLRGMSRRTPHLPVVSRASMVARHVTSTSGKGANAEEPQVLFESELATRTYILNRPAKLNALTSGMIRDIRSKVQEWDTARLCDVIIGTGKGKAFCAGGDIHFVMEASKSESTRPDALSFFKNEFEMNHLLGNLSTPYVAIIDGVTMGGGAGLSMHAPFRVATERTQFAMPETKIGYVPDVGMNHFLSRLDGEIGTYLALTSATLKGRAVFEHGIATHYIPASRIPDLKARLSSLEKCTMKQVDAAIEELHLERGADEAPPPLSGETRVALDTAFSGATVQDITAKLTSLAEKENHVGKWAAATLHDLNQRSPTSLTVALEAVRRAKNMSLGEVLQMEMSLATAFINGATPDFSTGVTAVLVDKKKDRPDWTPNTLAEIKQEKVIHDFFDQKSPLLAKVPKLSLARESRDAKPSFALPSEEEIGQMVMGSHSTSGDKALTLEELLERFAQLQEGKHGVWEKVFEVAQRRCVIDEKPKNQGCLRWIH